jgi:hypothetical protein
MYPLLSEKKMAIIHKKILTTSGYKPDMKYKPFNHADTCVFFCTRKSKLEKIQKFWFFNFFVSFLAIENLQNHFIFEFWILYLYLLFFDKI